MVDNHTAPIYLHYEARNLSKGDHLHKGPAKPECLAFKLGAGRLSSTLQKRSVCEPYHISYIFLAIWQAGTEMGHTNRHKYTHTQDEGRHTSSAVSVYNFHQHYTNAKSMSVGHSQEDNSLNVPQSLQP